MPLEIHADPRGDTNVVLLVWEGFNTVAEYGEYCTTVVAVATGGPVEPDPYDAETVFDWAAYQAAYPEFMGRAKRIEHCRRWGNKVHSDVAKAMFPHLASATYRD